MMRRVGLILRYRRAGRQRDGPAHDPLHRTCRALCHHLRRADRAGLRRPLRRAWVTPTPGSERPKPLVKLDTPARNATQMLGESPAFIWCAAIARRRWKPTSQTVPHDEPKKGACASGKSVSPRRLTRSILCGHGGTDRSWRLPCSALNAASFGQSTGMTT